MQILYGSYLTYYLYMDLTWQSKREQRWGLDTSLPACVQYYYYHYITIEQWYYLTSPSPIIIITIVIFCHPHKVHREIIIMKLSWWNHHDQCHKISSNDDEVPASDVEQGGIVGWDLWVEQDSAGGSYHLGECCDHHDDDMTMMATMMTTMMVIKEVSKRRSYIPGCPSVGSPRPQSWTPGNMSL